ncbi:unnamed protein product [Phaedon cochleariae]|uniref:Uncharacterized protein n=1 Tax=Phaedon cochleariae TaxID=80249 RepID=A0A9P0DH61_PHACE|nr:unnamed protein product [Phaedon cochleariae]
MSKVAKKPAAKVSKTSARPSVQSKSKVSLKPGDKGKPGAPPEKKKAPEFVMPAFSILPKAQDKIDWEVIKARTMRRQAPEGEDIKEIRRILKEVKDQKIPVHDFINLVSSYTADNGAELRTIMAEDEATFLKLARKVYETMTQDVSDVLVNEQLQMAQYYEERHNLMTEKMMRAINEIYEMAPDFDFEKFVRDREDYLKTILPLPIIVNKAAEDIELQRRQEAYHRLQWLRSEGERMTEENRRLQRRLEELKEEQKREQIVASEVAAEVEAKRQELVVEETKMKDQLDVLNESVEKTFIENEAVMSKQHNVTASTGAVSRPPPKKKPLKKRKPVKKEWVSEIASEMDDIAIQQAMATEAEGVPPPTRLEYVMETPAPYEPPRQRSPFHFSPEYRAPPEPVPPREVLEDTRIEQAQVRVQQRRPVPQSRASLAPRDTWGGFH